MNYSVFENCISAMVNCSKKNRSAHSLGIELTEYSENYNTLIDLLWSEILTEEGLDWLNWFLYEKGGIDGNLRDDINAWDENKIQICYDLKSLYDYLRKSEYFRKEYAKL